MIEWTDYIGRVYQGDCLEFMAAIPSASVDFIFTDPPYGHNNNDGSDLIGRIGLFRGKPYEAGSTSEGRPIANDGPEANELVRAAFREFARILKPGSCCCGGGGGGPDPQFARWSLWLDETVGFKQMIVWDKGGLGMGWHYRRCYETVLVGEKAGAACQWYGGNSVPNVVRYGKIIPSASEHPTTKPVALAGHFMQLHTQPGDLVLDPFLGAGTTAVAGERLERRWLGCEIDPHWAAMAEKRIEWERDRLRLPLEVAP